SGGEYFGVSLYLMNVGKQGTIGAVPIGAVFASSDSERSFVTRGLPPHAVGFGHRYTYSAHPVACASGLAALAGLARDNLV
ncbi:aspartate aminotransferase family protein, partial [Pseudomonas aeruginosa]